MTARTELAGLAALVCVAGALASVASGASGATAPSHPCLVATGSGDLPFARNFNPFANPLDFTSGAIYEPLVVVTSAGGGRIYDWLASKLAWSRDLRTLTLTVRHGVRWSDGLPLTNEDVAYTLTAGRQDRAMDQIGLLRPGNEVEWVRPVGTDRVAIRLSRVDTQFVETVLANNVRVVPKHVWTHVRHPATWLNPSPVGTGPFDLVERFGNQSYVLGRNPRYWQPREPRIRCVERVVASSPESAVLQMVAGEVDVTDNLLPNVRKAYVAHDPAHFHYYYPADAPGIGLFFDDTAYPFSIVALRKAISLAIDRETLTLAEYRYARTVDAIGINRAWPGWVPKPVAGEAAALAAYDPQAARQLLLGAGFTYDGTTLLDPKGDPVTMDATVIAGWSDWYADWDEIAKDLDAIGIAVTIDAVPNFGAWVPDASTTKKATLLWSTGIDTTSPYGYFKEHLDASSFVPSGADAELTGDWEHFRDAEATALLGRYRATNDVAVQHRIAARLERIWLDQLPFVPLFATPAWSTYSTRYFVGFPSAVDDYVVPDFTNVDYVVALTRIRPRR